MSETDISVSTGDGQTGDDSGESTSIETLAKEKGWRPKEEYEGDPDRWVGADEFVKRQPLFDKIKVQSKKLKELESTVEALAKHYQMNIAQAKEKAILDLKLERKEAIELGEADRVDHIDERINQVKSMPEPEVLKPSIPAEVQAFVDENASWFNKDEDMTNFAVAYNIEYLKKHPGDLEKSLSETAKAVKRAYPEKFVNTRRVAPATVESGGSTVEKIAGKYSMARLNNEQKTVYNQLVKVHKQLSHEEYFKSLEDAGYLD